MTERHGRGADMLLFRWGDELRRARARRRRLRRRTLALGAGLGLLLASAAMPPRPRLVWNASASAPIGLYRISPGAPLKLGDMVIARVPEAVRSMAARRGYIPANVPLVKRVAAVPGDEICAFGPTLFVNGTRAADRRAVDGAGRPLPWWTGCRRLRDGTLLLLMSDSPYSLDGRYFGPTARGDVIGKAGLLWAR